MIRFTALACLFALPLSAQEVTTCDARAPQVKQPPADYTRSFANGNVELAVLQVAGADHAAAQLRIEIVSSRTCRIITRDGPEGWATLWWDDLEAGYDPAVGLIFKLPAQIVLPESNFSNAALLTITVNQATSEITVTGEVGPG